MRRAQVAGFVGCLWLVGAAPAHAVLLRYAPTVGAVTKHKLTLEGEGSMVMGGGESMEMEISGSLLSQDKALSQTAETSRVETRLTGGTVTVNAAGQSQAEQVPTGRTVVDVDRRGRLVKVVSSDLGEAGGTEGLMGPGAETWSSFTSFAAFPEGEVGVGEVWSDELKIPGPSGAAEMTVKFNSRLLALTTLEGRRCAKIRSNFRGGLDLGAPPGTPDSGSVRGMIRGDIVWHYDYENSVYVRGEGSVEMDINMTVAAPGMPGMGMTSKMRVRVKLALVK